MKLKIITIVILIICTFNIYSAKDPKIKITSEPSGATMLNVASGHEYTTPVHMRFRKGVNYELKFSYPGYKTKTVTYKGGSGGLHVVLQKKTSDNDGSGGKQRINITSDPSGAKMIHLGSGNEYTTPLSMRFRIGATYELKFSKSGYKSKVVKYKGGSGDLHVRLSKKDDEKQKVSISSNPSGAKVYINDEYVDDTPMQYKFKIGRDYEVLFKKKNFKNKKINYEGGSGDIHVSLKEKEDEKIKTSITSEPSGARVYINSNEQDEKTPLTVKLKIGREYEITFKKKGYNNVTLDYTAGNGSLHVKLKQQRFRLSIDSNVDDAVVFIDDEKIGSAPIEIKLERGTYEVKVKKNGYKTYKKTVTLDESVHIYAKLEARRSIKLKLPKGAQLYINGEKQKLNFKDDEWRTFTFFSQNDTNEIKIRYHGITIKRNLKFDNSTYQLSLELLEK